METDERVGSRADKRMKRQGHQFKSEQELAEVVCRWLENQRWEVFSEVTLGGPRADIVARQGPLVWVIETKLSFGLDVLGQANHWTRYANYVSCACPWGRGKGFAEDFAKLIGVGSLRVGHDGGIFEGVHPRFRRRIDEKLKETLRPEHKTFAKSGSLGGGYWTPFQQTVKNIQETMGIHPEGITIKDLMNRVNHHYGSTSTARNVMLKWIDAGYVKGVTLDKSSKPFRVIRCESVQSRSA